MDDDADLLAEVDRAFATTGASTPGWPDPHPNGAAPLEEEYSRCLDPGKFRILETRMAAWVLTLTARGLVTVTEATAETWFDAQPDGAPLGRVQHLVPSRPGGLTLLSARTIIDGAPFGLKLGVVSHGQGPALLQSLPDCGCDACDHGSADVLACLDGWVLTVARGGVIHARGPRGTMTRTIDGWQGQAPGRGQLDDRWLDADAVVPDGVQRWIGEPWR